MSTGRLSRVIAETFAALDETERIFYVCGERAVRPLSEKAEILPVGDAAELAETVTELCWDRKIDVAVHAMAVGDYTVRKVSSCGAMAENVLSLLGASGDLSAAADGGVDLRAAVRGAIWDAEGFPRDGKIPSDADDLVIFLQKTPKVISMLRGLLPQAVIVGFKLLDGVTEARLIETAHALLRRNDCDFILANDLRNIGERGHIGHLVDRDGTYTTHTTKEDIARGIADAVVRGRKA
jgi:phosphopantothenate-cysteine ligase